MNILHCVESYAPSKTGMAEQVRQVSERLVAAGHSVTVATSHHPERVTPVIKGVTVLSFDVSGNLAYGISGCVQKYRNFLIESEFDVVVFFAAQQWATDAALDLLPQIAGGKVFTPVGLSGLKNPVYAQYFQNLPTYMHLFDAHIFLSSTYQDIHFARQHGIQALHVIPNGADEDEFSQTPDPNILCHLDIKTKSTIALVGNHTSVKGHLDAMKIFSAADIHDVTLCIVGCEGIHEYRSLRNMARNALLHRTLNVWGPGCRHVCADMAAKLNNSHRFKQTRKQISLYELSRPDLISFLHAADFMLFPSNVECSPIVLFEAAASGTPFLSTDVGNAREIARWTGGGDILPTTDWRKGMRKAVQGPSAQMLAERFNDVAWRRQCATSAKDAWSKRFTWGRIATQYLEVYQSLNVRT